MKALQYRYELENRKLGGVSVSEATTPGIKNRRVNHGGFVL